jgi:SRSO17 transposase
VIRRSITDGDLAFFSTWCPTGTSLEKLVPVEGYRRATAKNEFGLDHDETRFWYGEPNCAYSAKFLVEFYAFVKIGCC